MKVGSGAWGIPELSFLLRRKGSFIVNKNLNSTEGQIISSEHRKENIAETGKERITLEKLLIAHDLGTSGDKATLFTRKGGEIGRLSVGYDVDFLKGK